MRRILLLLAVLCAAAPAHASPPACQAWKKSIKLIDKQEDVYWDDFRARLDAVYVDWAAKWRLWRQDPDTYKDEVEDLSALRELYRSYVDLQEARAQVDGELAASGIVEAAPMLLDELLDVFKVIEKLEKEMDEARPVLYGSYYDQEPAVRLNGLAVRVDGLVTALSQCADAPGYLGAEGFGRAMRADKRGSLARRAAVLDALGRTRDESARTFLERALTWDAPGLRIVAVENLVPYGADVVDALASQLKDPSPAVRRALLESIRDKGADVVAWIPPVHDVYQSADGLLRARALEALVRLTGLAAHGDDPDAWRKWFDANHEAIEAGTWKRPEPKEGEAPPPPVEPKAAVTFYGLGVPSRDLVFVLDGSTDLDLPAELERQQTKGDRTWRKTKHDWQDLYPDHKQVLLQQLEKTLDAMPEDAHYAVVYLWGGTPDRVPVEGAKKPLTPSKRDVRSLLKAIEKPRPQGDMSVEEGLRRALGLSGIDPEADPAEGDVLLDTAIALHTGWIGGRWGLPEALVADFARRNRYYRLQVDTIRFADRKADAEQLMQGLAEATGGRYLWLDHLP